jgi:hypothetical protein
MKIMISRVTRTPDGRTIRWLPDQDALTDASGTVWTPAAPKRLTEQTAKRFIRRSSTRVAIERPPPGAQEIEWLDPAIQREYWDRHIAGHLNDRTSHCTPGEQGLTYHVSSWHDPQGNRMILISEMC